MAKQRKQCAFCWHGQPLTQGPEQGRSRASQRTGWFVWWGTGPLSRLDNRPLEAWGRPTKCVKYLAVSGIAVYSMPLPPLLSHTPGLLAIVESREVVS